MRRRHQFASLAAGLAALAITAPAAAAAPHRAHRDGRTPATARVHGPDLFAQAGIPRAAVTARIQSAYAQLFHGAPGTPPTHDDGQAIYYELNPTEAYVEDIGNQDVRTEGMGYAMMLAVQLDHRATFDKLWNFAYDQMEIHSGPQTGYFAWHVNTDGSPIANSGDAPDGDQWIAAALVFAGDRWGRGFGIDDYAAQARTILHAMWHASDAGGVDTFSAATDDLPGFSAPGLVSFTDPSYALPAFYRVFARADPADAADWNAAVTAGEGLLQDAPDPTTGLAPDYANFDGSPVTDAFGVPDTPDSYDHTFQEDAWRTIANANVDASWWGPRAWQTRYSDTLEQFFAAQPGGIAGYTSRYHLDGTPVAAGQNTYEPAHAQGLVAMNASSADTADTPDRLDFVSDLWNTPVPSGQARYYDGMLYLLGLLYTSGRFDDLQAAAGR